MAEGNFEKAGIALEIKGFTEYINRLKEVDDTHIKIGANAGVLTEKLTNLEKVIANSLNALAKIHFDSEAMGIKQIGNDMDNAGDAATEFGKDMSEAAKALKKLESISSSIETFERLTQTLIQNTGSLEAGFERIQAAIKDIDMDKLSASAVKAAESIEKLATAMGQLEASMGGNKLVTNLGKLIPLLLAAGDIKKLGAVGKGISSIVTSLSKIDAIPDFAKNQDNFNALIRFVDRLSLLRLPPSLPQDLIHLGDALHKMVPGVKEINKVKLDKHTTDGIDALLTTLNKFSGINTTGFAALATGIEQIAIAFRTFGAGGNAGTRFTGAAVGIANAVEHILNSLQAFVSQQDAPLFIKMVGELGDAIKLFAQGMNALGRDFANTMANVPAAITIITQSIVDLQKSISGIKDVDIFAAVLKKLGEGAKALQTGFASLGRSTSIRQDLAASIQAIIDSIKKLSSADIQNASLKIQGLVGPITQLSEALKILRKQRISDNMVTSFRDLAGEVGLLERAVRAISKTFQAFGAAVAKAFASISKLALHGLANSLIALKNSFQQLIVFLLKLPFTLVVAGFRLIAGSLNLLFAPIRTLIEMLSKLSTMLGSLFRGGSRNVGSGLGLDSASQDVQEFDTHISKLQTTLYQTDNATKSGAAGFRNLGESAERASVNVTQLDKRLDSLNNQGGALGRIFGSDDMFRTIGMFSAANIAADLVTDSLYGMIYGFRSLVTESIEATSRFEQLNLQLTSLQAKEAVKEGLFPDVPTALNDGIDYLQGNVKELINEFRILAIQSPFETDDVANSFRLAQAFGFTTEQGKELVRTLVDAGSALGFTGADLTEVTRVFGQIRTTGKLMAQDLNQLASRGIGVKQMFADIGISAEQLAEGSVKADDAIKLITRTLQRDFQGAALRSANSIEGLVGSFKSFREEGLRTFAQPIVEMLRPLAAGLGDALFNTEVFDKIEAAGTRVAAVIEQIILRTSAIAGMVKSAFDAIPQPIKDFVGLLSQAVGAALAATSAVIALQAAIGLVAAALAFAFVSNPIGQLTALIFVGVTAMNTLQSATMTVGQTFELLGKIIRGALSGELTALDALYDIQRLPEGLRDVAFWLTDIGNRISGTLNTLGLFANIFATAFSFQEARIGPVINLINQLDAELSGIGLRIAAVGAQLGYFGNIVQEIGLILVGVIDPEDIQTIVELFNLLPTSVQNAIISAGNALQGFVNLFINWRTTITNLFNSVANAAFNLGANIGTGIQDAAASVNNSLIAMANGANSVIESFFGTATGVTDFLVGLINNIYEFGSGAVSAFADGMVGAVNLVVDAVQAIADAISWLLSPGSPPRAMPEIDEWGKAAGQEFVDGMSEADTKSVLNIANGIQESLGNIRIPAGANIEEIFSTMNWSTDDAGNIIDSLGNMVISQEQLAEATRNVADELERVNAEIEALDKAQSIQKQQNLVNNLKAALAQPGLSESNRMALEQQLKRAELELRRLQLEAEEEGLVDGGTGGGIGTGGGSGGSGGKKPKEPKAPKEPGEPDQKFPKIDKAIKKTGKKLKEMLDLAVPDTSGIEAAFGDPASGNGLLGKVTSAFEDAKKNIGTAVQGIKDEILRIFGELRTRLELVIGEIIRLAGEFGQAFTDAFGNIENQGPIAGAIAALATATYLSGGWGVLLTIAGGITAIGAAWAVASGQVDLNLPDSLKGLQTVIDDMREGFKGAEGPTFEVARGVFVTAPGKTLAETIMGFDSAEFAKSVGALLFSIGQELGNFVTKLDEAVGNALKAPSEGKNPLLEFIQTFFDIETVKEQIRTELTGLGTLISSILSGEFALAFNGEGQEGVVAMSAGGQSVIANFIIEQIRKAGEQLAKVDFAAMFAEAKTKFQEAVNGIFTMPSTEGLTTEAMGVGGAAGTANPVLENIKTMFKQVQDIMATDTDMGEFGTDVKELGVALQEFGVSAGTLAGVVVGTTAALSIIGSMEIITKLPSVSESAIQIVDNLLRGFGNLILAISQLADPGTALDSLANSFKEFAGVFTEINELQNDTFSIISGTVDGIIRLVAAITGVKDAEAFAKDSDIVSSALVAALTAILGLMASAALTKAAAAVASNGPKILEILKGLPKIHLLIIGLSSLTSALKEFDQKNENVDIKGLTDFLDQVNVLLIAVGAVSFFTGGKVTLGGSIKGILNTFKTIGTLFTGWQLMKAGFPKQGPTLPRGGFTRIGEFFKGVGAFLTSAKGWVATLTTTTITKVGPILSKIGPLFTGTIFPFLQRMGALAWSTITGIIPKILPALLRIGPFLASIASTIAGWVSTAITAIAGAGAATIAAWAAVILAIVGTVIGLVEAFRKDIGGIRTDFLEDWNNLKQNVIDLWNSVVGMFTNLGDPKAREEYARQFNESWKSILGNIWGVISYIVPGTTNNTELIMSTVEGFVSFFDGIFGTNFAERFAGFFDPIRNAIDELGTVGDVFARGIERIRLYILQFIAIKIEPLDRIVLSVLGFIDSIRLFGQLQLDKMSLAIEIFNTLFEIIKNPFDFSGNKDRLSVVDGLLEEFGRLQEPVTQITLYADEYEKQVERFRTMDVIESTIEVKPTIIGPLAKGESRDSFPSLGGFGEGGFGSLLGISENTVVPVALSPEFSTDNTSLNTALTTIETDTTAKLTALNSTISSGSIGLQTQIETDYTAIATTIGQAGVDGTTGFMTGIGTLPTDVEVPLDELIATINSYGGETGAVAEAGSGLGVDFADGYIAGIESKKDELISTVTAYVNAGLITVPRVQKSGSPSKVMWWHGEDAGEGYLKGLGSKEKKLMGVAARFAQAGMDQVVKTIGSSKNQAAINRVLDALIPSAFKEKGLIIDFSEWEIHSDSETDVAKRATDSATGIAEQFGNQFARVTNQIFDEIIGNNMSLAPGFFGSEEINEAFAKEMDAIFKHRDDTLAQLTDEGKAEFNRNFAAAFTDPEGVKKIAQDFLNQFDDEDFFNLPKVYGAIDAFVGGMRSRLEEKAAAGDGWAMGMIGGLDNLQSALETNVQSVIDEMAAEGESAAVGASSVGSAISSNIASGTTSTESLGGLDSAVTTLAGTLVSTITTEFEKITAIITGQGAASSEGFITGVNGIKETMPTSVEEILEIVDDFRDDFYVAGQNLGEDFADGYTSGIILKLNEVEKAAKDMVDAVEAAAKAAQDSSSPSKKAMAIGRDFADGYAIGITGALATIAAAGADMVMSATAPILENAPEIPIKQGNFWIDETKKYEPPVDPEEVDRTTESMNALERATETASKMFDSFGESFGSTFDGVFDKFLEMNPGAIENIWDIRPIRDAATQVAEDLRDTLDAIGEELTPEGQSQFSELIKQMFGDEETISTLVNSFIDSFSPEELAELPDAAAAIDTFIRQIEDVFLEDEDYEGWLAEMGLTDDVVGGFAGISNILREQIQAALDAIAEEEVEVPQTPSWIDDMFGTPATDEASTVGEQMVQGIYEGVTSATSQQMLSEAATIAIDSFMDELRRAGDIHSPSKLTMRLAGEPLVDGIIVGMRNRLPNVISTAKFIGDKVARSFGSQESEWLRHNTIDQGVNLKYNGLVSSLPELFQQVNGKLVAGAGKLGDNIMMAGNSNARTGMLTNYSVINNTNNTQDEYHLHMDVKPNQIGNVRRNFRVAKQLGIN